MSTTTKATPATGSAKHAIGKPSGGNLHSPGPWSIEPFPPSADDPQHVMRVWSAGDRLVAICKSDSKAKAKANSQLIAAAPDLYSALKEILSMIESGKLVRDTSHDADPKWYLVAMELTSALQKSAAAIAKAETLV